MIEFVDPRGEAAVEAAAYDLTHELRAGSTVALMANGFPDSVNFLEHIAAALSKEVPGIEFERFDKGNASRLASDSMLDDAAKCDVVIAAYGH